MRKTRAPRIRSAHTPAPQSGPGSATEAGLDTARSISCRVPFFLDLSNTSLNWSCQAETRLSTVLLVFAQP